MLQVSATPPAPPLTTASAGTKGTGCQKLHKKKKFHVPSISAYEGKCEEIKQHVYDVVPWKNGFDVFAKTTTEIGKYIARNVPNASKFTLIMRLDELGFPVIPAPPLLAVRNDLIKLEVWHIANKQYNKKRRKQVKSICHCLGPMFPNCPRPRESQPNVPASVCWSGPDRTAATDSDIQVHRGNLQDTAHALIDAMERFHSFKQSGQMDNTTYLHTFQSHIEVIDHLGGGLGIHVPYIQTKIQNAGGDLDDVALWSRTKD
jgi:hypothetical protein